MELSGLFEILLCMGAGIGLRASRRLPERSAATLNGFVIHVSLPALILWKLHEVLHQPHWGPGSWIPLSMAWIQFGLAAAFACVAGRICGWSRATTGTVMLTTGLGNTSFVGFPLLEALYGPRALPVGILVDEPGSFLVFATIGVAAASVFSGKEGFSLKALKKALIFPPLVAMLLSVFFMGFAMPPWLASVLEKIAASLVPVALVSVGFQLRPRLEDLRRSSAALMGSLAFKLVVVPALMTLLYFYAANDRGFASQVTIVESAMAPMISGAILADDAGLDSELASLMVGIGIPLSLLTVPVWAHLLKSLAG